MGNMKFDGADVTFELDGYDALVERVRSKKVNCKINPSDLPRLYAVMDAELEGNEELAAAFAEAQEAAFGEAVLTVWAERIKSFKDSFIPVFGEACKDAACRFGFSWDRQKRACAGPLSGSVNSTGPNTSPDTTILLTVSKPRLLPSQAIRLGG